MTTLTHPPVIQDGVDISAHCDPRAEEAANWAADYAVERIANVDSTAMDTYFEQVLVHVSYWADLVPEDVTLADYIEAKCDDLSTHLPSPPEPRALPTPIPVDHKVAAKYAARDSQHVQWSVVLDDFKPDDLSREASERLDSMLQRMDHPIRSATSEGI